MTDIYVLKLRHGKYYVGKTQDVQTRFHSHMNGQGCEWTRLHPPLSILEVRENQSPFMEDAITKEFMEKFGCENVRGGSYSQIDLRQEDLDAIKREMRGASDRCLRCGRVGHWARDCFARTEVDDASKDRGIQNVNWKKAATCYNCGRKGHIAPECWS